jgi:ATP-binding cassette, subfamily B, bacterial
MITLARNLWPLIRRYRRGLLVGALFAGLEVLFNLAGPWPLSFVVDQIIQPNGTHHGSMTWLAGAIVAMLVLVGATSLLDYWSTRLLSASGLHLANDLRDEVFSHLQRQSLRYHGERQVGDLAARVTGDVERSQDTIVQTLSVLFPNLLLITGMFVVMVALDPWFTLLALGVTPPLGLAVHHATRQLKASSRRARRADGQVAAAATENLSAMQLIQAYSLEDRQRDGFAKLCQTSMRAGLETARLQARLSPIVDTSSAVSTAIVLWFGSVRVLRGDMTLGVLLVFLSYLGSLYKPIKALSKLSTVTSKGLAASERVMEILKTSPQIVDSGRPPRLRSVSGRIELNDVGFTYGREAVLANINLQIGAGETIALVGPTGAGKSTLASLVPRFIDPDTGAVRIDGHDLREVSLRSVRHHVSMVLQDCVLLRGTLRDNIACGFPGASEAAIDRAVRLALVDEFSNRLPDGLDTMIGERGNNLSGGQRQRVAIARAILSDRPILILDEPTSALDPQSEELLVEALSNLPSQRTTLVIAHRMSTVRHADRIAVMESGRIIELGTPDRLLRSESAYRHLVDLQNGFSTPLMSTSPGGDR